MTLLKSPPLLLLAMLGLTAPATAADWSVDSAKSRLGFSGNQSGQAFTGTFRRWDAHIAFDPAHPEAGHAEVTIDMTSAVTGDTQKDLALPGSDWFDAKTVPQARFTATSFRAKGGNAYEAIGKLALRKVEKDVVLPFTLDLSGDTAHAQGHLDLLRTEYGVGQGAWTSAEWVALEVAVTFDLTASRGGK